jgi:WS/DGAT/MGAT family acyltransferase
MVTACTELTELTDTRPERDDAGSAPASPLSATESVLWKIERDPALRSTIIAIAVVDGTVDIDRFRRRIRQATEAFPRLRQRVTRTRRGALLWSETRDWDVDQHITHVRLPAPGSMRQLLDLAGEQAGEAFDPARPVWHLTLVEGLERDQSALVIKLHHAMADGVGGIGLLWLFTDAEPHPRSEIDLPAATRPRRPGGGPSVLKTTASVTASVVAAAITDPLGTVRSGPKVARSTVRMLAPATRARSPLTTGRGLDRHLEVFDVPLRDLERAGHAVNGSVNDAFMAAVVGGLHRYHLAHGQDPTELRVTMPISVRRDEDDPGGNRFTPARFTLPLGIDDPARRMEVIGEIARRWRREPAVGLTDVLATALAQLPDSVTTSLFGSMLKGVDFMATNVPGARHRCWLAGAEVMRLYGFGPTSGSALNIALVSHLDTCDVGLNIDTAAIDDPDLLRASIEAGFAEVVAVGRSRRRSRPRATSTAHAPQPASAPIPRRLSTLDASFLEAESDITPMHIGALIMLEGVPLRDEHGALRIDDVRAAIAATLPRSPRMLQVVRRVPFARPVWEDVATFDIAAHVRHVRLPAPGTQAELEALCHELQMEVLDRSRPLWEMWFVDGLANGDVALVSKIHHAIVDGVSAAETFEVLLGDGATAVPGDAAQPPATIGPARPVEALVTDVVAGARVWLGAGARLATDPARALATVVGLGDLVLPSSLAPRTSLNRRPVGSGRRLVPVAFDVAAVKEVAHRHHATVNDVLLTLVGCGLGELLAGRGEALDHLQVLVPVSLRGHDEHNEHNGVGNRVGALIVPVQLARDPVAALAATNATTRARKHGPEAAAFDFLLRTSDTWPAGVLGPASRQIVHHQPFVNLVVTNVRGTERPLSLLGSRITGIVPIIPLGGNLSIGVAALSYAGRMIVALHADAEACPDVDIAARGMEAGFARLQTT